LKLVLAVVSGVLCALQFRWSFYSEEIGYGWLDFGIAGALFGVAVLCPHLVAGPALMTRALALIGASAFSYFCAMTTAMNADAWLSAGRVTSFLIASFIGVSIVLAAARILIPLRVTAAFWFLGLAASGVGGLAMYAGMEVLGDTTLSNVAGFCVWHILVCLAIDRAASRMTLEAGCSLPLLETEADFQSCRGG
jgi:hypothetical protein